MKETLLSFVTTVTPMGGQSEAKLMRANARGVLFLPNHAWNGVSSPAHASRVIGRSEAADKRPVPPCTQLLRKLG